MRKNFIIIFLFMFFFTGFCSFIVWKLFLIEKHLKDNDYLDQNSCTYEAIDLVMPVHAFLIRGANSSANSYVRRLFVHQWISSNQKDLLKLVVYVQGAKNYEELKKAFLDAIEKEGKSSAASFVQGAMKKIDMNPKLIEHINQSLIEGFDQSLHTLRGQMMGLDQKSIEYKKLKNQYRKKLDEWIDQKHGKLLDEIIANL